MAKGTPFTEQDLINRGFVKNEQTGEYEKPKSNLEIFPKSFTEKKEGETIGEIPAVKLDVRTKWFISYNVPSLKNSKRIVPNKHTKRGFLLLPSELHEEYKKMTEMQYTMFGIEFRRAVKVFGLSHPLFVEFTYIRSSRHKFDYTNAQDTVQDLMVKNQWIEDDSADHLLPIFIPYQYDKTNPGVLIRLITNK